MAQDSPVLGAEIGEGVAACSGPSFRLDNTVGNLKITLQNTLLCFVMKSFCLILEGLSLGVVF